MKRQYPISNDTTRLILTKYDLGELTSLIPLKAGLINPAFLINSRYVLRVDKSEHLKNVQGYDTRFEREAFLYRLLPKKGVPTPNCLGFDNSGEIIPEKYIIVSYIPGVNLSDGFRNLDGDTQNILSLQMGEVLRKIHSVTPGDLDSSELFGPKTGWKKLYEKEFTFYLEEALKGKYFSPEIEEEIKGIYRKYQDQTSDLEGDIRLVHSDFSASNIQINDDKIVGIFDFEWSHAGDPLWDLQKLPVRFQLGDGFNTRKFLKGYGMENPSEEQLVRVKMYSLHQGLWEIWATKTQLFPFGEKEIKEGRELVNSSIAL